MLWLLLIYTVPAEPTRKRAFIWRLLKKIGAVYLRDGICVLPEQPVTHRSLTTVADKVREFGGHAHLAEAARLDPATDDLVRCRAREARQLEYAAVVEAGAALVAHMRRESRHRSLHDAELHLMHLDLVKLRRWRDQIQARDYFTAEGAATAEAVLVACETALNHLAATAAGVSDVGR
ncbi:MAG: hypothetical protein NVSMB2_12120 [Chloroflexota bacterium]